MRLLLALLTTLVVASPACAFNTVMFGGGVPAAAPGGAVHFSETFDTAIPSSWDYYDGGLKWWSPGEVETTADLAWICAPTALTDISGYALVQLVDGGSTAYRGIGFRESGGGTGNAYAVRANTTTNSAFRTCVASSCSDIATSTAGYTDGDWFGITWDDGTGDDIIVKLWDFGATPPTDKTDPSTWGTASETWEENIDDAKHADTGKRVCLYTGSSAKATFDNFYAGDLP